MRRCTHRNIGIVLGVETRARTGCFEIMTVLGKFVTVVGMESIFINVISLCGIAEGVWLMRREGEGLDQFVEILHFLV